VAALAAVPALGGVRPDDGRVGWLVVDGADVDVQGATAALGAAGIPLLAFELEGARLSDAYLAMTGAG
jgi:ABC-2 type transport system ATP-binding protein